MNIFDFFEIIQGFHFLNLSAKVRSKIATISQTIKVVGWIDGVCRAFDLL